MNWPNHHSEYKFLFSPPRLRMMCAGNSAPIMWYPGILWKGRIVSSSGFHFWFQKTKVMPGDVQGTCGCFQKYGPSPQIIPFVHRVFHEMFTIHFGGKHPPYFWKHPCGCKKHLFQTWLPDEMNIHLVRDILDTISHTHTHTHTHKPHLSVGPVHVLADHMAIAGAPNWEAHLLIFGAKSTTFAKHHFSQPKVLTPFRMNDWNTKHLNSKTWPI